ncbi:hypothetical protein DFH29DRAFT_880562 [Suillus ampliporus]|nr:hypothetical protein DFH29DRAFT_880562 [Suillus ampliporus]
MSSTLRQPALASLSSPDQVNSHTLVPGLKCHGQNANSLNCAAWRNNVEQPQDAYPSPPTSHGVMLQKPPSMDTLCLPPFWETSHDSDLTVALISVQRSERRAESRLIHRCLKRAMIEQELYSHMDQRTAQRLRQADTTVGISRGVLRMTGLTPACKAFDDMDSNVLSVLQESDIE